MFAHKITDKKDRYHTLCFYALTCHWCKEIYNNDPNIELKTCGGCRMIAYCNQDHQKKHWQEHKDLCKAIQEVHKQFTAEISACQETRAAMKLLREKVTMKLKRELKRYEVQMFKYPRMCWLCHEQNSSLVEDCPNCMTSFCSKHKNDHDKSICSTLFLAFKVDLCLLLLNYKPRIVKHIRYFSYEDITKFDNMKSFIKTYKDIMLNNSVTVCAASSCEIMECQQSVSFSRPLTVLHGLRVLDCIPKNKKSIVIHVIAAYEADALILPSWEVILHLIPTIKSVKLVMIVPNLKFERFNLNVCHNCKQLNKTFFIEWYDKQYKNYVQKSQRARPPDLVVGFHVGFYEYDDEINEQGRKEAWMSSVQAVAKQNCPFLLTFYSESEAKLNIDKINFVLEKEIDYFYCERNPFTCLKPCRWFADNPNCPVFYENSYLLIYRSLYT